MEIAFEDLKTMFKDAVVLYTGRPVKVLDVGANNKFLIFDLITQKREIVEWDFKKFRNPTRRLGMVNLNEGVVYVSRIPHRKYSSGLTKNNLNIQGLEGDRNTQYAACIVKIRELMDIGIGDALNNAYPTFKDAKLWVKQFYGTYAFDKQFALDTNGYVWYKTKHVGNWTDGMEKPEDIQFLPGAEHLKLLLNPDTEILRTH